MNSVIKSEQSYLITSRIRVFLNLSYLLLGVGVSPGVGVGPVPGDGMGVGFTGGVQKGFRQQVLTGSWIRWQYDGKLG